MSNKTLEDKAVEIMDASQAAIGAFADKMVELGKQYGPDVADMALQMARIDALQGLVWPGIFFVILCVFGFFWLRHIWAWMAKGFKENQESEYVIAALFGTAVWGLPTLWAAARVFDVWRWVGIFEPKLWLAKRILGL